MTRLIRFAFIAFKSEYRWTKYEIKRTRKVVPWRDVSTHWRLFNFDSHRWHVSHRRERKKKCTNRKDFRLRLWKWTDFWIPETIAHWKTPLFIIYKSTTPVSISWLTREQNVWLLKQRRRHRRLQHQKKSKPCWPLAANLCCLLPFR